MNGTVSKKEPALRGCTANRTFRTYYDLNEIFLGLEAVDKTSFEGTSVIGLAAATQDWLNRAH